MKKIIIATIVICLCTTLAFAEPVTFTDARSFRVWRSQNALRFPVGDSILVIGEVDPYLGTHVWGRDESGDLGDFEPFNPQIFIGQFGRTFGYNPAFTDRWELWACNNEDCENSIYYGPAFTNDLEGVDRLPFVTDVAYYFASQDNTPTISWQVPDSSFGDRIRITVIGYFWDGPGTPFIIGKPAAYESPPIPLQTTQHKIPDDVKLISQPGFHYAIRVKLEATDDDTMTGDLISRSESFFSYTHGLQVSERPIFLPMVGVDSDTTDEYGAAFKFDCEVLDGESILIDPFVAIGYDYKTGEGDPAFTSVTLPVMGDNVYDLYLFDEHFLFVTTIEGGVKYDFPEGGVDSFRILEIEEDLRIDPSNTTAFVTELTFAGDGRFTGTMTPIITSVPDITVDIKPGSDINCINKYKKGVTPVAILGSEDFDVLYIDVSSIEIDLDNAFSTVGVSPTKSSIKDVNGDGFPDLNLKFNTPEMFNAGLLDLDNIPLFITGTLTGGTAIIGSDVINLTGGEYCF